MSSILSNIKLVVISILIASNAAAPPFPPSTDPYFNWPPIWRYGD